jgi:hypothetical protein
MHDEWQAGDRRYLSEGSMALLYPEGDTELAAELNSGDSAPRINLEFPPLRGVRPTR